MSDTFFFRKSWGAEFSDGALKTRLWAPGVPQLDLVLGTEPDRVAAMEASGDGWHDVTCQDVRPGTAYAFRLPDGRRVPDPAARAQAGDVHGPSKVVDPRGYRWRTPEWRGRPWEEAVILELHAGTFTPEGTFAGIQGRLDHIRDTGITAIELMPVAQFGGNRGWGYDGVLLYAPHNAYGGPDDLKALIDAAHERDLMVLLDVVYNHFGPDGNYLHLYASEFFTDARETPWGAAIAYERPPVRDFFVENALYWLEEYRFDGLRLDAVNEIHDGADEHLLETIGRTVRERITDREIHLTTEDDRNITRLHKRGEDGRVKLYTGEWNDDFHHAAHVIATGESEGYYMDYAEGHTAKLARALAEGYIYQGEPSQFWDNTPRGEPSSELPPVAMVNFIQNHDQIGNRAFNERLSDLAPAKAVEALTAILLLAPQIPMLFMGEEWGETNCFGFFTDFHGDLADAVREGRRREFRRFARFADPQYREQIPDPNALSTFEASRIDWTRLETSEGAARYALVQRLLELRHTEIVPRLSGMHSHSAAVQVEGDRFAVSWTLGDGSILTLIANLTEDQREAPPIRPAGKLLFETEAAEGALFPGWYVAAYLDAA